jgi:uncharacterized repeat protein (TIGR03847 family)
MEPGQVKYSLGAVSRVGAESFGEPGRRTFRLGLEAGSGRFLVWLEKEQLYQLGIYLQEALRTLSEEDRQRAGQAGEPEWSGGEESVEFKARQMMLSFSVPANYFYLLAYEADEGSEAAASVSCWLSLDQAERLSREALQTCASGRPPCFLCGMPINPDGHVCPRANGHAVLESG